MTGKKTKARRLARARQARRQYEADRQAARKEMQHPLVLPARAARLLDAKAAKEMLSGKTETLSRHEVRDFLAGQIRDLEKSIRQHVRRKSRRTS